MVKFRSRRLRIVMRGYASKNDSHTIVHIITGLGTGGAERALYNLLSGDHGKKYRNVVVSLTGSGVYGLPIEALGVQVHCLDLKFDFKVVRSILKFRTIIRDVQPDLIQGWMYHGNLFAIFARFLLSSPVIVAWNVRHSLYSLSAEKFLTRLVIQINRLFSRYVEIIFYNSGVSREQHEDFGFHSARAITNPNGFDTTILVPCSVKRANSRVALCISDDQILLGHVARYHPMKDHDGFISAVVPLLDEFPTLKVVLVGRNVEENVGHLIDKLADHLRGRFVFTGERSDVYDLMQACDLFCLSSAWGEGFPNVLGEAMSLAIPCVTTDVADSSSIVGSAGLVVPPRDAMALSSALASFIKLSPSDRQGIGKRSRDRILEKYSQKFTDDTYESAYAKALSSQAGDSR